MATGFIRTPIPIIIIQTDRAIRSELYSKEVTITIVHQAVVLHPAEPIHHQAAVLPATILPAAAPHHPAALVEAAEDP